MVHLDASGASSLMSPIRFIDSYTLIPALVMRGNERDLCHSAIE